MKTLLKSYLKKLTNLSGSNKSLLLLRLLKSQDIDVHDFDFLTNEPSFSILEKLVKQKGKIKICTVIDPRLEGNNTASKQLKKILRKNKQIFEERGAQDLYIGWPFVEGKLLNDTPVRCPLIFFPIHLYSENNAWYIGLRENVSITFNKSFLLAYSFFNDTKISDELLDTNFNDWDKDFQEFKNQLYKLIDESPLELNFNQHLFEKTLLPFTRYQKQEYVHYTKKGMLKLQNQAVMGLFPQADSYLVPDYEWMIDNLEFPNLEEFFISKKEEYALPVVKEEQTFTPFSLDAFQEHAIHEVKKGKSISVQGPPGTGKSQLICNLVTDFIARGKKVLVVCQKKAALDVVYDRLATKNIENFIGQVNDFKTDRSRLFQQLNTQAENAVGYKRVNSTYDIIQLERDFAQISRKIDSITEELVEFKEALFDTKECGTHIKELYLKSNRQNAHIPLRREYNYFTIDKIEPFNQKLKHYLPYVLLYEKEGYPWVNRKNFQFFTVDDLNTILVILDRIPLVQREFKESTKNLLGLELSLDDTDWLLDREKEILEIIQLLDNPTVFKHFQHFLNYPPDKDWLFLQEKILLDGFKERGLESTIPNDELGTVREILDDCIHAFQRFDKWMIWKVKNRKETYRLQKLILNNKLEWDLKGLKKLAQRIDNRLNFQHNLSALNEKKWTIDVPNTTDLKVLGDWFYHQQIAIEIFEQVDILQNYREHFGFYTDDYDKIKQKTVLTFEIFKNATEQKKQWEQHLSPTQLHTILNKKGWNTQLQHSLEKDFDNLCEYDRQTNSMHNHEIDTINKILEEVEDLTIENCIDFFMNSVYCAWAQHIETKYPILRSASSLKIEQLEEQLWNLVPQKQELAESILQIRLREHTYRNFEYNRLDNLVTYRELQRQTTKKRRIWTIRKLMESFPEEMLDLVPCWLASPESVSAIFPMNHQFDLVIFDEASQCFSEKSIPALYRGKQIVITGDEQQLPPNDLYQIRWEQEEEDENPDLEIESLLTLANHYLPQTTLQEHYRSQSLDLIAFSNQHFYENKLRLLPHFDTINQQKSQVSYKKIDGVWEQSKNINEAHTVVEIIEEYLKKDITNIGVVTFNSKQQECIQDVLERQLGEDNPLPTDLFVKNIENVQGDERDIIIFSIGYAPSPSGKMSLNFGSLNTEKGENRLNVAITRAKKEIIVVSSILPNQLDTKSSKNRGPQLLKAYLQYVYEITQKNSNIPQHNDYIPTLSLKQELENRFTPNLTHELPFGDLSYKNDDLYKGLILTDDDIYQQSISVKDSYAYFPLLLQQKQWKFVRAYSRNFWNNKSDQELKVQNFLGQVE